MAPRRAKQSNRQGSRRARKGSEFQKKGTFQKWSPILGEGQTDLFGAVLGMCWPVSSRFGPPKGPKGSRPAGAQDALKWPGITQNGSSDPRANRRQPPTANQQPGQTDRNVNFQKSPTLGEGQTDHFGPVVTCFRPFSAVLAHCSPVSPRS